MERRVAVYDIEGDALYEDVSKVHCAWLWDSKTKMYYGYPPNRIHLLASDLNYFDTVAGHNIIGYDNPTLGKLQETITPKAFDTLVGARLLNPDIVGGHSLKAWGKRLGVFKDEFGEVEDDEVDVWKEFSWEMYWYCRQDVVATVALYQHLIKKGLNPDAVHLNPLGG